MRRGRFRRRTFIFRKIQADALLALLHVKIGRPFPGRDREVDFILLRRNAHHLGAAPGDGTQIAVHQPLRLQCHTTGLVDFLNCVRNLKAHDLGRIDETFGMFLQLEDFAAIGSASYKHAARVMQTMRQHMHLRILPRHQLAVEPDETVALIERYVCHRFGPCSAGVIVLRATLVLSPFHATR